MVGFTPVEEIVHWSRTKRAEDEGFLPGGAGGISSDGHTNGGFGGWKCRG